LEEKIMCRRILLMFLLALALAPPRDAAAEIRIGFAYPLSGSLAASGERNRIAAAMAVRDLNREGGVLGEKLALIVADDACGIEQAVAAARKLIDAGVRLVVGHACSHSSLMAAGIYDAADVLMISPSSTHPRLTEEGRGNVFRLIGRDDEQGDLAGDLLADRFAEEKIAILHDGSVYGEGLAAQTRHRLRQRGVGEALYGAYQPGAMDYATLVARLRQAGVDVLYIGGYGPDAGRILRTARERGDDLQMIGGDGLGMDEFWMAAGAAGKGTIFSDLRDASALPDAAAVLARFEDWGLEPRTNGLGAYAAVQVWAQAVERAGSAEPAAVAAMLRRGRFESVLGKIAFDDKGDLEGAAWQWQVWRNGRSMPLDHLLARQ
jgi:branched-chain amino acid transport system substrate-binding protein